MDFKLDSPSIESALFFLSFFLLLLTFTSFFHFSLFLKQEGLNAYILIFLV